MCGAAVHTQSRFIAYSWAAVVVCALLNDFVRWMNEHEMLEKTACLTQPSDSAFRYVPGNYNEEKSVLAISRIILLTGNHSNSMHTV